MERRHESGAGFPTLKLCARQCFALVFLPNHFLLTASSSSAVNFAVTMAAGTPLNSSDHTVKKENEAFPLRVEAFRALLQKHVRHRGRISSTNDPSEPAVDQHAQHRRPETGAARRHRATTKFYYAHLLFSGCNNTPPCREEAIIITFTSVTCDLMNIPTWVDL